MRETAWESYEEVAAFLLDRIAAEFGLERVEGKQKVSGITSGTDWELDAKGVRDGDGGFVIIECRRHKTAKLKQEAIAGLAFRIQDTGARGGIIVSPLGLQEGAAKVAESTGVISVRLDPNSTTKSYVLRFLNKVFVGLTDTMMATERVRVVKNVVRTDESVRE